VNKRRKCRTREEKESTRGDSTAATGIQLKEEGTAMFEGPRLGGVRKNQLSLEQWWTKEEEVKGCSEGCKSSPSEESKTTEERCKINL